MIVLDYLALFAVSLTCTLIERLPDRAGLSICRGVIGAFLLAFPRFRKSGRRNLELTFPEKSEAEREDILRRFFEVLARNLHIYATLPRLTEEQVRLMIDYSGGRALFERLRSEHPGRGLILATLHYGSFELFSYVHALHVRPAWVLARGFGLRRLDDWWFSRRERFGCKVFRRKGAFNEILKRLQEGDDVAILFDQNVKRNHAVFVNFLGRPAATTRSLALASIRTGAPIAVGVIHEDGPGKYRLICNEVDTHCPEGEDAEASVRRISAELNQFATNYILEHPENWFWIHRRFKTRPPGEAEDLYSEI